MRRALSSAAPREITAVEVAAGPLTGISLQLDLQVEKDLWLGTYETALLEAVDHFARAGSTVYDVGANIGYVSLALAKAVREEGRVVAFEPLPANLARLRSNLALNSEGKRVQVVEAAVGAHTAQAPFLVHASGGMGKLEASKGRNAEYEQAFSVEVIALDDWIRERAETAPSLVKIDVEGGEGAVLEGMAHMLVSARPTVLIELHGPEAADAVHNALSSAGYTLREMRTGYPEISAITEWKTYLVALPLEGNLAPPPRGNSAKGTDR